MTYLAAKLREYGFPEPDLIIDKGRSLSWDLEHDGFIEVIERDDDQYALCIAMNTLAIVTKLIKTDSDWRAVANFIKFLIGESDGR